MDTNWKEEIFKLLSTDEINVENIKKSQNIKKNNIPKSLYKFRSVTPYSLDNLRNSTLYLATASKFNDPYDSAINFDPQIGLIGNKEFIEKLGISEEISAQILSTEDPFKEIVRHALKNSSYSEIQADSISAFLQARRKDFLKQSLLNLNEQLQNSYKICSLSERIDSLPMWAHYADNHQGFVMEYDFQSLEKNDIALNCLWPVYYNGIFDASSAFKSLFEGKKFNNLVAILAALHKSPDWSYECEWRLVLPDDSTQDGINFRAPLKAVYLGTKMKTNDCKNNLSEVIKCAELANIPVYRMHLIPEEFRVEATLL